MQISIALRCKPFSHAPGAVCLIPGTIWRIQAFPTHLVFFGPSGENFIYTMASCSDCLEQFTIEQNLDKREINILRGRLKWSIAGGKVWENGEPVLELPSTLSISQMIQTERLSLGVHKAQEWESMRRRLDLMEIFPLWFQMGQITPQRSGREIGVLKLLEECKHLRSLKEKLRLEKLWKLLFLTGFGPMFDPRIHDPEHRGIIENVSPDPDGAIRLVREGADLIRSLLITQDREVWTLLPCLLPHFHSGRFLSEALDLEWSNAKLRRVIIHSPYDQEILLDWPEELTSCRIRKDPRLKGERLMRHSLLNLKKGEVLYLDRFERG
jgi:hypothetical protein